MKIVLYRKLCGSAKPSVLLLLGILAIGGALRAPITVVGPLMDPIRQHFNLGVAQAGMLTALPLLAFAIMSPIFGMMGRIYGLERVLFGGLAVVTAGILLRSSGTPWALFAGTWLIGAGLAAGNVLLPSMLKRDFPKHIARTTAGYTLAMALTAGIASAIVIPIARWTGNKWEIALGSVVVLPVLAMLLWLPQLYRRVLPERTASGAIQAVGVWNSPLAWQISLFMGLNSVMYYVCVSWLPSVLVQAGFGHEKAGFLQGNMHLASAFTAVLMALFGRRASDQRWAAFGTSSLTVAGFIGLAFAPTHAIMWTSLLGVGIGAGMIQALSFLSMRAAGTPQVASLSGMAQCVGYLLASVAPPLMGMAHEMYSGWTQPLLGCAALGLIMAGAGWLGGRDVQLGEVTVPAPSTCGTTLETLSPVPESQFVSFNASACLPKK